MRPRDDARAIVRDATAFAIALMLVGGPALAQKPDRSSPPRLAPPPPLTLPAVQKHRLSNGLQVWIVEQHEVPMVQINLIVRAGSAVDPAGKYGIAAMTASMLDEGAGGRSALELADAVEFLGADLSTTSTFDYSAVRLSTPVTKLSEALPLMADVVMRPTFSPGELERLRKERLTRLLQARDDPAAIMDLAFPRLVFGRTHRYGTADGGGEAEVRAMTPDDVRAFHAAYYRPEHATLLVVGDITASGIMPLLEQTFGAWKPPSAGGAKVTPLPAAAQLRERRLYIIDKPGAAQSQIRIGWVGVPRSTPDYPTLQVLNTILGGSFTSRLNTNLRETHGYAYGAFSVFEERISPGTFSARAGVQTDKTAEAVREFFNEFGRIREPIPGDELDKAKNYVALGFPAEFETTGDFARKLEEQVVHDLPEGYFGEYMRAITTVTGPGVERAAAQHIQPERFAVVIVGDRKVIEQPVRALKLGPVDVLTVEDVLGKP
ncbi:MAG TPA: pitrilysin family protein [Vicinamibacterales bacterium]|nr:pitrilysin family protein [Vicinamibacterales bacterium]